MSTGNHVIRWKPTRKASTIAAFLWQFAALMKEGALATRYRVPSYCSMTL